MGHVAVHSCMRFVRSVNLDPMTKPSLYLSMCTLVHQNEVCVCVCVCVCARARTRVRLCACVHVCARARVLRACVVYVRISEKVNCMYMEVG